MTGVEVLRQGGFECLKGKRVGLITNPTGVDSNLKSTVDILFEAEEVDRKIKNYKFNYTINIRICFFKFLFYINLQFRLM